MTEQTSEIERQPLFVDPPPVGIKGWLVLVALGQIFGPIKWIVQVATYYAEPRTRATFGNLPVTMYGELVLNLMMMALMVVTAFSFFARKGIFKLFFTIELLAIAIFFFIDAFWVSATADVAVSRLVSSENLRGSIVTAIVGVLWIAYIWRSRRVRNTFVR